MKIVDLSNNSDFSLACSKLYDRIEVDSNNPPLFIGIETGGVRVVEDWTSKHVIDWCAVKTARPSTRFKALIKPVLSLLPVKLSNVLRNIERTLLRKVAQRSQANPGSTPNRVVTASPQACQKIASANVIVMVDDAIDSGATIHATRRFIRELNSAATLEVAALTLTEPDIAPEPDYLLYRAHLLRFPWSNDRKK